MKEYKIKLPERIEIFIKEIIENEMIIIATTYKKTDVKIKEKHLDSARDFFSMNLNKWVNTKDVIYGIKYTNVRRIVNELRNEGMPIVSGQKGYKLTTNKNEIKQCYSELRIRALRIISAAKKMKMLIGATNKVDF